MKKLLFNIIMAVALMFSIRVEAAVTTVGNGSVCPGDETTVPISVTDLNGVSAISLALNYDVSKITYVGFQDVNANLTGTLLVNASGGKVYISWYSTTPKDIGSANLLNLRFEGVESGNSNLVWATNLCEYANVTGDPIASSYTNGLLSVNYVPVVTNHPSDVTVTEGSNAIFQVSASGTSIAYLWQVKSAGSAQWTDIANSNNYRLTISSVTMAMNGNQYRCVVSGTCSPEAVSEPATLNVNAFVPTITTTAGSDSDCPGNTLSIPVSVTNCNNVGSMSLSLNYNSDNMEYVGYENLNAKMSLLGTFEINDNGSGKILFTWVSNANALNIDEAKVIDLNFKGQTGVYNLTWNVNECEYSDISGNAIPKAFTSGLATIYSLPAINANPVNTTVLENNNASFSVSASGHGITYQWQMSTNNGSSWNDVANGGHYWNANAYTLYVDNVELSMNGYQYRCKVSGTCGEALYSEAATLTVDYFINTVVTSATTCFDEDFTVDINVSNFNNVGAVSLTLNYNVDILTFVEVSDVNAALGTGLLANAYDGAVYISWYSTTGATIGDGTLLKIHFIGNPGSSQLTWNTAKCEYATSNGTIISKTFSNGSVTVYDQPTINQNPVNVSIYEGQNTYFTVSASGQGRTYQWQVSTNNGTTWSNVTNGGHYGGVNSYTLNINNVELSMTGYQYRCQVTGTCGEPQYSEAATLTVIITQPVVKAENIVWQCNYGSYQEITVQNFTNVGAFSLVLSFNTECLEFAGCTNLNSALNANSFVANVVDNKIYMTYASGQAVNIGNGSLFRISFNSTVGTSNNTWQTNMCEVADIDGNVFNTSYVNGTITVNEICTMQTSSLVSGWNWYSSFIEQNGTNGLEQLENSLGHNGTMIKSQTLSVDNFYSMLGYDYWYGELESLTNEQSYMINTISNCNVAIMGDISDPASHPITIQPNWNWIGYPVSFTQTTETAMASFVGTQDDVIKSQGESSTYWAGWGWWPSINLEPGNGYLYQSNASSNKTLVYDVNRSEAVSDNNMDEIQKYWTTDVHAFADNLTVIASVTVDNDEVRNGSIELGAFVDGENRGSAILKYFEPLDSYYAVLTVSGADGDMIDFGIVDRTNGVTNFRSDSHFTFETNAVWGNLRNPYLINFDSDVAHFSSLNMFPNPVSRDAEITLMLPDNETVKEIVITNVLGERIVLESTNGTPLSGFKSSGIYIVEVICESGSVFKNKLIVR